MHTYTFVRIERSRRSTSFHARTHVWMLLLCSRCNVSVSVSETHRILKGFTPKRIGEKRFYLITPKGHSEYSTQINWFWYNMPFFHAPDIYWFDGKAKTKCLTISILVFFFFFFSSIHFIFISPSSAPFFVNLILEEIKSGKTLHRTLGLNFCRKWNNSKHWSRNQ